MLDNKEKLILELEKLGIHKSGRKVRSDAGTTGLRTINKIRSDKGIKRTNYQSDTAAYARRQFKEFIRRNSSEFGDNLVRDDNMIFPPNVTNFYKKITVRRPNKDDLTYASSVKRKHHPEELRWNWYFKELEEAKNETDKIKWSNKICDWYFILPEDIYKWSYLKWADAYSRFILGYTNRTDKLLKLNYDTYELLLM